MSGRSRVAGSPVRSCSRVGLRTCLLLQASGLDAVCAAPARKRVQSSPYLQSGADVGSMPSDTMSVASKELRLCELA